MGQASKHRQSKAERPGFLAQNQRASTTALSETSSSDSRRRAFAATGSVVSSLQRLHGGRPRATLAQPKQKANVSLMRRRQLVGQDAGEAAGGPGLLATGAQRAQASQIVGLEHPHVTAMKQRR